MKLKIRLYIGFTVLVLSLLASCQPMAQHTIDSKKTIAVTYSILGSLVKELVDDNANVVVLMPNGADPHEWEPSARDIETVNKADLIVQNGLGLESGIIKTLEIAGQRGVKTFVSSDHITVRRVGEGEGIPTDDPDQAIGAEDPHLWTDPLIMKKVVSALASQLRTDLDIDTDTRSLDLQARLSGLNDEISAMVSTLPQENRKLVTGHESMGYFAQRYGFRLVGAVIPSVTTQAEVSASDLAQLNSLIEENKVKAIFTELGTSPVVAQAIAKETGVRIVELSTHVLPADGSYFTFELNMAKVVVDALR